MSTARSDALVFLGATGDLAFKKIFPALQSLIRHGKLDVPIVGVAKSGWGLDDLRERTKRRTAGSYCGHYDTDESRACHQSDSAKTSAYPFGSLTTNSVCPYG